ncbi:MAG: signal recognition particle-docking protein FtsY [Spirochaetaceae bacterium]
MIRRRRRKQDKQQAPSPRGGTKSLGERLKELFSRSSEEESFYEGLEDLLIEADMGQAVTMEAVEELRTRVKSERLSGREEILLALADILARYVKEASLTLDPERLNVFLVLGVNGVGKTTTIAKLARHYEDAVGRDGIVLAAGDTFRAAAIDQLALHGERLGVRTVRQAPGADPGAVIYDALESTRSRGGKLVLADTAGRMHNKQNLVAELSKIDKIIRRRAEDAAYLRILVIDATTGQNALRQAEIFNEAVGVDAVILAKYDSTAKGGILAALGRDLGVPCAFLGRGESYDSLEPFDARSYLRELLGEGSA